MASIVVLTGAGISKESGLDTFRDADGIWSKIRLEDVATPEAFRRDRAKVQSFYNARRRALWNPAVQPNAAHLALARLEREWRGEMLLVTQNIDDLHERAGSRRLVHMHGEMLKGRCTDCAGVAPVTEDLDQSSRCAACGSTGTMRPHVVWFGEMPLEMERIYAALAQCALFVSIGTSGTVYPAANFVNAARETGAHTVELNLEPSNAVSCFHQAIHGPAGTVVPSFVERLLALPES